MRKEYAIARRKRESQIFKLNFWVKSVYLALFPSRTLANKCQSSIAAVEINFDDCHLGDMLREYVEILKKIEKART